MDTAYSNDLELQEQSQVAVIGGGPAGSFFTYFALDFAQRLGLEIQIDIYEAKDFDRPGPLGCNHCGGIVSESLIQMLSAEGIVLPSEVIRRGIDSYTLHLETGKAIIETPLHEQRIAAVYRGFGPKGADDDTQSSFDGYLLDLCKQNGAVAKHARVTEVERVDHGMMVRTNTLKEKKYDLVVGAGGLGKQYLELFGSVIPNFQPPKTTRTHICEFYMEEPLIDQYFGNSMHVFLLNIPHIQFGALIPKGHYVTLVLLGDKINGEIVQSFLSSKEVRDCFPPTVQIEKKPPCMCFPSINIQGAKTAYADRVILIGDSSSSKLYKNGIGSAYITGKAAAKTVIFQGISKADFESQYKPVCSDLDFDNNLGKLIFLITSMIQKSGILKKGIFRMVVDEQTKESKQRHMSSILWDTFTGSAPYNDILRRGLEPHTVFLLFKNIFGAIFN
jgi:flavin-dependent dehydrogenase